MTNMNEKDWKLFRQKLPVWQESYIEKRIEGYKTLLESCENASEKFWKLDERIKQDKRSPGVLLKDVRRSNMDIVLLQLLMNKVISRKDLEGFSNELCERLDRFMENFEPNSAD